MKTKCKVQISRDSNERVRIRIQDDFSRQIIADISMSLEMWTRVSFSEVWSGIDCECGDLTVIGKKKEIRDKQIICPLSYYKVGKAGLQEWLLENGAEDGWIVDPYLGSQKSVTSQDDSTLLSYTIYRYVDIDQDQAGEPT